MVSKSEVLCSPASCEAKPREVPCWPALAHWKESYRDYTQNTNILVPTVRRNQTHPHLLRLWYLYSFIIKKISSPTFYSYQIPKISFEESSHITKPEFHLFSYNLKILLLLKYWTEKNQLAHSMILLLKIWLSKQFKVSEVKSFADKQNCIFITERGRKCWRGCSVDSHRLCCHSQQSLFLSSDNSGAKAVKAGALKIVMYWQRWWPTNCLVPLNKVFTAQNCFPHSFKHD